MNQRWKKKGRGGRERFAGIPHNVMDHPDYFGLSGNAAKLLFEFAKSYNGRNNGDLSASFALMKRRGWRSKTTLKKCINELLKADLIVRTREGYFQNPGGVCALYAITWNNIDDISGKNLEMGPTSTPLRSFSPLLSKLPSPESGPGSVQNVDP